MNRNRWSAVLALTISMGISGSLIRVNAAPSPQDESRDKTEQSNNPNYTSNKNYQVGERDGQNDYKNKRDHSKKRHFKKDEDQKAYEAGYQHGQKGDQRDERQ